MKSEYFIGIDKPADLRRDVLQAAKVSITILKAQYRLKEIREQKIERLAQLREIMKDLDMLMERLHGAMPMHQPTDIPEIAKRAIERARKEEEGIPIEDTPEEKPAKKASKKAEKSAPKRPLPKTKPKTRNDLDALEEKLNAIESKLNKL